MDKISPRRSSQEPSTTKLTLKKRLKLMKRPKLMKRLKLKLRRAKHPRKINATKQVVASKDIFKTFPVELRLQIYELLLINKDLSTGKSLHQYSQGGGQLLGVPRKLELSPAILGTCRYIYVEASAILYGGNVFIVDCTIRDTVRSPVLRGVDLRGNHDDGAAGQHLSNSLAVKRIRKWKVLLGFQREFGTSHPNGAFLHFCQTICDTSNLSLNVGIIPRGARFEFREGRFLPVRYNTMEMVFSPLQILRNLQQLTITQAFYDDIPVLDPTSDISQVTPHDIPAELVDKLKERAEGSQPVRHVFKMHANLATYAQLFERNPRFRAEMDPTWGVAWDRSEMGPPIPLRARMLRLTTETSLFKIHGHPVENNLERASMDSDMNNYDSFQIQRANVLLYLEDQYHRIASAARMIAEFTKSMKSWQCFLPFAAIQPIPLMGVGSAVLALEKYSEAFRRDVTGELEVQIRRNRSSYELAYADLPREDFLGKLGMFMEKAARTPRNLRLDSQDEFLRLYKGALADMDGQYVAIRKARKALFEHDGEDYKLEIDLELWQRDEMIDWDA